MARKRDYAEDALPQQPAFKRQCALSSPQRARDALADAGATFLQAFGSACGPGATGVNDLVWWAFNSHRACTSRAETGLSAETGLISEPRTHVAKICLPGNVTALEY